MNKLMGKVEYEGSISETHKYMYSGDCGLRDCGSHFPTQMKNGAGRAGTYLDCLCTHGR